MSLIAIDVETGMEVPPGEHVVSKLSGRKATLQCATRPTLGGRSGKVAVEWELQAGTGEYYSQIFGLRVERQQ